MNDSKQFLCDERFNGNCHIGSKKICAVSVNESPWIFPAFMGNKIGSHDQIVQSRILHNKFCKQFCQSIVVRRIWQICLHVISGIAMKNTSRTNQNKVTMTCKMLTSIYQVSCSTNVGFIRLLSVFLTKRNVSNCCRMNNNVGGFFFHEIVNVFLVPYV